VTPAATVTPTATTIPSGPCAPRPNVTLTTRPLGSGRLEVTVEAKTSTGTPTNGLVQITFGSLQNASVQLGASAVSAGTTIPLGSAKSAVFVVTRGASGQATMVPFTVRDACGDWPTFVGGGPNAF